MRVLRVLPSIASASGGPVRSMLANCQALHATDPEISFTLATTDQGLDGRWRRKLEGQMPSGSKLWVFSAVGRDAFTLSYGLASWLWTHVANFDLVVIHALLHPISSTAAWIARRRGVPYVVVPHGTLSRYTFEHRRAALKRVYWRLVERHTLAGAAAVRFTSQAEREEAPPWERATSIRVIPHPHASRLAHDGARAKRPRQILFLSRLDPMKGIDVLLDALPFILARIPDGRLVVAGSGAASVERHLRSKIRNMGLGRVVDLAGFVEGEQKERLLLESSVFVLPSHRENFGVAVVEAMDAGLPVVVSRGVAIWPEVERAGAGVVVSERRPQAIASAVSGLLLQDASARDEMGRRGQQLVRSAFNPKAVGRDLLELYRAAARGQSALDVVARRR